MLQAECAKRVELAPQCRSDRDVGVGKRAHATSHMARHVLSRLSEVDGYVWVSMIVKTASPNKSAVQGGFKCSCLDYYRHASAGGPGTTGRRGATAVPVVVTVPAQTGPCHNRMLKVWSVKHAEFGVQAESAVTETFISFLASEMCSW